MPRKLLSISVLSFFVFFLFGDVIPSRPQISSNGDCIIFVHGFLRSSGQFKKTGQYFAKQGYDVVYADYHSRKHNILEISQNYILPLVQNQCPPDAPKIHFITHSAGAIAVRYFLSQNKIPNLGRVVMLAPPNQGSQVADLLSQYSIFNSLLGPLLTDLRTGEKSFLNSMVLTDYEFGVIAGHKSNDPISSLIIPGDDDGKVSVTNTKLANMQDFLLVNRTHTFIMNAPEVRKAALNFIETGSFK